MPVDQTPRSVAGRAFPASFGSFRAGRLAAAIASLVVATPGTVHAQVLLAAPQSQLSHAQSVQAPARVVLAQAEPSQPQTALNPPVADRPAGGTETPAIVVDGDTADALLGKAVQSANGDDMGRVVDVIIDRGGAIRAAVIDFGGFLGVGARKIAVDWRVLNFAKSGDMKSVVADLSQDQLRTAPAYKPGEPVVIVGRADAAPAAQPRPAASSPAPPPAQAPDPQAPQEAPERNR